MYKQIIEKFEDNLILDSIRIQYTEYEIGEDLLNSLTLRVIRNGRKIQYRFNEILEYSQVKINNVINEFYIDISGDWNKKYLNHYVKGNQNIFGEGRTDVEFIHYVFILNGICFNILAKKKYIIDENGFFEIYRTDSKKIRKIVS